MHSNKLNDLNQKDVLTHPNIRCFLIIIIVFMGLLYVLIMSDNRFKVNKHSIGQSTLYPTLYSTILSVFLFCYCNSVYRFELLFLLFVFTLFVSTMNFLGNVLFLGNMRRFRNLLSNLFSTSLQGEEAETGREKDL